MKQILALLAILLMAASGAQAACMVSATGVLFGAYNATLATPNDATGSIKVICNGGSSSVSSYTIALSTGSGGSYAGRRMISGTSSLPYQLYQDASHSIIWGDGSGGSFAFDASDGIPKKGGATKYSIFGRIPAHQSVTPGVYSDSIIVTVTY